MYTVFSKGKELHISESEWSDFCGSYKIIEAAGGLVQNVQGEYLMIFRNGKWDLPKGKREENESMEQTALREVEEECNINSLILNKLITITYHSYSLNGEEILKPTCWYSMAYSGSDVEFRPQVEEGIELAQFMSEEKIVNECFKNCYSSIRKVFAAAGIS